MKNAVLVGFKRSPFTIANKGLLAQVRPEDILPQVINDLIKTTKINKEDIDTPEELMKIMRDTIKSH